MTTQEALKELQNNLQVAIQDQDGLNPEYERQQIDSLQIALEALEKQIPKKPLIWRGIKTPESPIPFDDWGYECPCCGNQEIDYPDHHCECGQALDWREDNDT